MERLAVERDELHRIPDAPYTAAFGESRSVWWTAVVSFRGGRYSVPDHLAEGQVWVRAPVSEAIIVSREGSGVVEVARHRLVGPGEASITDEHYRNREGSDPLPRTPKATNASEAVTFLALGEAAKLYLVEAAASGVRRIEARMKEAVTLAALHGPGVVDHALSVAATIGRISEGDLGSIIVHGAQGLTRGPASEHSLSAGTAMWSGFRVLDDGDGEHEEEEE